MAYSANDFQKMVEDYVKSSKGRKFLKEKQGINVGYTSEQMRKIGENLKKDIIEGFLALTSDPYAPIAFAANNVAVHVNPPTSRGVARVTILFHSNSIKRPSLYEVGEEEKYGVYDIIGLFTQGYFAMSYAYGIWGHNIDGTIQDDAKRIRSRAELAPNPFVNQIIHRYQKKYPDVVFEWPKEWGGNK